MKKHTLFSILLTAVIGFATSLRAANSWTPAELTTELWFDAADTSTVIHSSNSVSQWNDKSGNGRHATQTTGGDRPTLQAGALNSKAVLRFDGSNDKLFYPGGFIPGDAVVVFKRSNKNQPVVQFGAGGNRGLAGEGYPTWNTHDNYSTDGYALESSKPDSSVGSDYYILFGGGTRWTGALPTTITENGIGYGNPGYAHLNGDIAEIVVFSGALSTADRDRVVGYLAHKWGQTAKLPGAHPYKSSAPLATSRPTFLGRIGTSSASTPMRVEFTNGGSLIDVASLSASSFSVPGGVVSGITKVADGNYTFTLTPTTPGTDVTVSMASGVKDSENNNLLGGSFTVRFGVGGLYRPDVLTGYWNFDEGSGNKAQNSGTAGPIKVGTLNSGATFNTSDKKFGASSLRLSDSDGNSRVLVTDPLDLGGTLYAATFTISTWFKEVFPTGSWRTLSRGSSRHHHVMIQNNGNKVGVFANNNGNFRPTPSFELTPTSTSGAWHHLVAVSTGGVTNFYYDSVYMGSSDRDTANNIYSIGGSNGGGQRFSKFLDDFRVYSVAMDQADVEILYNGGNGDIGPETSLVSAPVVSAANSVSLTLDFKRDGSNVAVTGLTAGDFQVTNGTISGLTAGSTGRYTLTLNASSLRGATVLTLPTGSAYDAQARGNAKLEYTVDFVEPVTRYADLEGWWKFDGNLNDVSGNARNGTHANTTDYENLAATGKFGNALYLDGTNEHVVVTGYKGITGSAARTMTAWIKTSKSDAAIMNWGQNAALKKWTFRTQTDDGFPGSIRVEINGGARVGDVGADDDAWHHVAAVLSGTNLNSLTFYLDGQPLGNSFTSAGTSTINTASSQDFRIGNDFSNRTFKGLIDDARLYSVALSGTEVASVYGNGLGDFGYAGPIITGPASVAGTSGDYEINFKLGSSAANVTGFSASDISVPGASVSAFNAVSASKYTFKVTPQAVPSTVIIGVATGAANLANGRPTIANNYQVDFTSGPKTRDLVAWWKMDEGNGTTTSAGLAPDPAWSPTSLSGLALWLDAADAGTITGTSVSAWSDKSGAGISLAQGTGGNRPTSGSRSLNGKNVIDFASNHWLKTNSLDLGTGAPTIQVVSVIVPDAYNTNHAYGYSSGNPGGSQQFSLSMQGAQNEFTGRHGDGYTESNIIYTVGKGYIVSHALEAGGTYGDTQYAVNGELGETYSNLPTNQLLFDAETPIFSVGATGNGSNKGNLAVGELLVFNEILNGSDRRKLEGYLSHKWGLAKDLVIGHEYRVTDGTLVGDAAWADAKFGKGIYFDGNDDGLSFADLDELDAPREFAISIWFKREADVTGKSTNHGIDNVLLSQCSAGSNDNIEIGTQGSKVEVYLDAGNGNEDARVEVEAGIQNNTWHHLVLTYSGGLGNLDLFVDGVKKTTWTQFSGPLDSSDTSPFSLGIARPGDNNWGEFKGWLDDFRVYDSYLDPSEVQGLYELGGERVSPHFIVNSQSGKYTESVNLQFRLGTGLSPVAVTNFTESDLNVSNGQVLNFTKVGDGNYTFNVRSTPWPGAVTVSLAADAATDANSLGTTPGSMTVDFIVEKVTQYDNMIAHWSFDETSGSRIFDLGPNGYDIPKIGSASRTSSGKFGGALNFPSNHKRTYFPLEAHPKVEDMETSFSFWVNGASNLRGNNSTFLYSNGLAGRVINIHLPWSNNNVYFDFGVGNSYDRINTSFTEAELEGTWAHWAFTHNRNTGKMKMFRNGVLRKTGDGKTKALGSPTAWSLYGANWYGMVDDFRVYSVELNSAEINKIYNDDLPVALTPFITSNNQNRKIQTLTVNFKRSGSSTNVTGLALDDFTVTGGTLSGLSGSGSTYTVTLTANTMPSTVSLALRAASVFTTDGIYANPSFSIDLPVVTPGFSGESITSIDVGANGINESGSNLVFWVDANEIAGAQVGQPVQVWEDLSGNDNHMDQVEGNASVQSGPSGTQVVHFDGNDRLLTSFNFQNTLSESGYTAFAVSRYATDNTTYKKRVITSQGRNWIFGHHENRNRRFHFDQWVDQGTTTSDTVFHLFTAVQTPNAANLDANGTWNGTNFATSVRTWTWMDGTVGAANSQNQNDNHPVPAQIAFGGSETSESSIAEVGEMLIFGGLLSDADRQKIEGYLGWKWGIYMDTSHPYKNTNPFLEDGAPVIVKNKLAGSVGTPTFYTVATTGSTPTWYGFANAPSWLDINSTNGQIFGTPPAVGVYGVKILAADAQGRVGVWSTNMRVTAPPVLTTNAADEIGLYGADVSGTITSDGGDGTGVKVLAFFGTSDGGNDPYAWQNQLVLGTFAQGADYRGRLAGLFVGQQYYFRTAGRNNGGFGGLVWSSTKTFSTLSSLSPPNLGPLTASKASYFDATLNGSVVSTGGEYPQVKLFWGNEDAGNTQDVDLFNNSKWDYMIDLGTKGTGPFPSAVTGLSQPNVYYFRAYAVNSGGSTWSPVAGTFNSKPLPHKSERLAAWFPFDQAGDNLLSATVRMEHDDWAKTGTSVNFYSTYFDSGTTSWEKHRNRAIAEGSRLPTTLEARLIRLSTYSDMWMPVGDSENRWMQVGANDGRRGRTHEEAQGAKPGWGTNVTNNYGRTMTWIDVPDGPDGETKSRRLKEDSSTGLHGITNGGTVPISAAIGQSFVASIHVKAEAGGRTEAYVGIGQDENGTELGAIYKVFNLSNGTALSATKTTGSSQPTAGAATITAVGSDGWYRITFAATLTAGNRVRFHAGTASGVKSAMPETIPRPRLFGATIGEGLRTHGLRFCRHGRVDHRSPERLDGFFDR